MLSVSTALRFGMDVKDRLSFVNGMAQVGRTCVLMIQNAHVVTTMGQIRQFVFDQSDICALVL